MKQLGSGLADSGRAIKGIALDTPLHLADSIKHGAMSVVSLAQATSNAVRGVFNITTAPL